jgi:membrane protein involved in colicin uptake
MSEEDRPTADEARSEARGAELRENIALTDARRAEEETAKAQEEAEKAAKEAEKRAEKARQERERAERVRAQAAQARERADDAVRTSGPATTGASAPRSLPPAAQRPEVLVGATFAGAFIAARILKRIFD